MSAFKELKDISNNFEQQLRSVSAELFSARIREPFEDRVSKKLQNLTFLNSKLRLLQAKSIAATPQVQNLPKSDDTVQEYGELAMWKVLEQSIVKSLTQAHAVKALITSPDSSLDHELLQRKQKIIHFLEEYRSKETELRQWDMLYTDKQTELMSVRNQWDSQLAELRDMKHNVTGDAFLDRGPLYQKLRGVIDRLELMRWLLGRLLCSRGRCDWLADPAKTGRALLLSRTYNTM